MASLRATLFSRIRGGDERGFTLVEVLAVLVVMGILFGIATMSWRGVIDSRRADSAANQLVADLRLAHSSATNRLVPWRAELTAGSPSYRLVGPTPAQILTRELPGGTQAATSVTLEFAPEGSVAVVAGAVGPSNTVAVTSRNDPADPAKRRELSFEPGTSRIKRVG